MRAAGLVAFEPEPRSSIEREVALQNERAVRRLDAGPLSLEEARLKCR
jgi:hypothetical protein